MNLSKFNMIPEYIKTLIKEYREQQVQNKIYRIVEIEETKKGDKKLVIQIIGKNVVFKANPEDIAKDTEMIEGFSGQDVRVITYFACEKLHKPKSKVLSQKFCNQLNKLLFLIENDQNDETVVKTANEISVDESIIKNLSQKDAHMVGYTAGLESVPK